MNTTELFTAAGAAMNAGRKITLVIPGRATRSGTKKLAKGKCPVGEILCEQDRGGRVECVCLFDPVQILAWMTANGLCVLAKADGTLTEEGGQS